jgi:hypothetical protein
LQWRYVVARVGLDELINNALPLFEVVSFVFRLLSDFFESVASHDSSPVDEFLFGYASLILIDLVNVEAFLEVGLSQVELFAIGK